MATPRIGYAEAASWMARDVDNETLVYRRSDELATRNLLYLQSELLTLEHQLDELDREDAEDEDMDWQMVVCDWEKLGEIVHASDASTADNMQASKANIRAELVDKLRRKLEEYHKTLLRQSEIAKLKRPNDRVLSAFKAWFTGVSELSGRETEILNDANDLVALNPAQETDYLSECLRRKWPIKADARENGVQIGRYEEHSVSVAVALISTLIAAILLIGSITGLYFVENDAAKLGLIAFFTSLFALSVGLTTNARRAEIFAGTAAYAAVLVVFVSGDLSSSQGS
ncbi:hypothetical protein GCG54_00007386 [Colletotrichum gloeosporioides]|uniref:DUF6594 domain-containing protein n=1 Tax=Colletotrichum gloeosporioides TaxID=474922 RepID=A0A8H4CPF6_COLGL|nr:uncharacterized protein GCG54_00007386 [Colletotrichum gloeosporioides]KAF3807653.1 hypothetical protein GCG54_00007386 [Colletotrichum gloeosporioides]